MKKAVWSGIIATIGMLALSTSVYAQQTDSGTVNVTATVNAKAKLSINGVSTTSISFGDFDPDANPTIPASPLNIDVKARTSANGAVTLTVRATQDLISTTVATDIIGISALKWNSTGANFAPTGTSNTAAEVNVMSFNGSGNHSGVQTYALDNSWEYKTGTYTTSLTYTLTAP
jgi:hypothetical protein